MSFILFHLICSIFSIIGILLITLAISSALFILAELAEEYSVLSGKIIKYLLIFVILLHILLYFDGIPAYEICIGIYY
jgi:hypothetical protein